MVPAAAWACGRAICCGVWYVLPRTGDPSFSDGVGPPGGLFVVQGGFENWFLWLKHFPNARSSGFFGGAEGVTSKMDPWCRSSDDATQLDKPVEVDPVVQHLPNATVAEQKLNAGEFSVLGQPVEHVG